MLTTTQLKYIELERKKEEYKKFLEEIKETTELLANEVGIGGHFQDTEGTVYQVDEINGKFVYFDKLDVKRTRRNGEKAGSLSLIKAKELGYTVE